MNLEVKNIVKVFEESENIDSIFLFGSRSKGNFTEDSDYDFGVIYKNFIDNDLDRRMRSQMLSMNLSKRFGKNFDIVDLEDAPIALKKSIIKNDQIFYQKNPESIFHVNRVLRGINSQYEKDFAPYYNELKGTY